MQINLIKFLYILFYFSPISPNIIIKILIKDSSVSIQNLKINKLNIQTIWIFIKQYNILIFKKIKLLINIIRNSK